ncbi:hypothetical protein BJY00DRAFT_312104 [Aspergillus carlsbadensis]|nr:hypothetical protein BJY00DRAFT_312104 [Aspergillus carlsbadensis]
MVCAPTLYDLYISTLPPTSTPRRETQGQAQGQAHILFLTPTYPLPSHESTVTIYYTKRTLRREETAYPKRYETCIETQHDPGFLNGPRSTKITTITLDEKKVLNQIVLAVEPCGSNQWVGSVLEELELEGLVADGIAGIAARWMERNGD